VSAAREAILGRLRLAGATTRLPRTPGADLPAPETRSIDERVARFTAETGALDVPCFVEESEAAVRARVHALISGQRVLSWHPAELPFGVGATLVAPVLGTSPRQDQAECAIGLTGCDAAIAETGTLAMLSAPGRSRAVSLLPPAHVAIVRRDQLLWSMAEFFAQHATAFRTRASCTFITGPSRTADIELTLTKGIHGPGQVIVVVGPS
jgi:L-lactate dehydrogenase complex protein LldG